MQAARSIVYITSAKGVSQGRGTVVLAPKSQGPAAKKSYMMLEQDARRQFAVGARVPEVFETATN